MQTFIKVDFYSTSCINIAMRRA